MEAVSAVGGAPQFRLEASDEAWKRAGVSRAYAYELMGRGQFPKPVKIGRAIRYVTTEIDQWIAARISERDAGTGV